MVITRSQAGSRQPLGPAASPRANPPRRAQSQTSSIPQQSSSEGDVSCSTRIVGGGSATPLAAGNEPHGYRQCRSDCMTCPSLNRNPMITSFVTGRIYPIRDIEPLFRKEMSVVVQEKLEVVLLHHWLRGMSPMDLVVAGPTA